MMKLIYPVAEGKHPLFAVGVFLMMVVVKTLLFVTSGGKP